MSVFDLNFGSLSAFASEPAPPKPPRPAPPPPLPAFLMQPQVQRATPPTTTPARHTPPPTPPAQSHKPRNGMHHGSSERAAGKNAAGRDKANEETAENDLNSLMLDAFQPVEERDQESGKGEHQGDNESGEGSAAKEMAASAGELDCDALVDEITHQIGEEGIFEVMMPDGNTLGVVVKLDDKRAQFLLSPSDDKLAELLKNGKMELQGRLAQRMNKDVDISLL